MSLVSDIAEILYTVDAPFVPWSKAIDDDRRHYTILAEAVLEAVADSLDGRNDSFDGALATAVQLIRIDVETARLQARAHA